MAEQDLQELTVAELRELATEELNVDPDSVESTGATETPVKDDWVRAIKSARRSRARVMRGPVTGEYKGVREKEHKTKINYKARFRGEHLGTFQSAEGAARAYDEAAVEFYGEGNCFVNLPDEDRPAEVVDAEFAETEETAEEPQAA
jgi:hypothetical protein